ncbi:MAG: tyrosine-type recombinase/integrase [Acidimicrobiales bacterium]
MSVHRHDGNRGPSYEVRYRAPDGNERSKRFRTRREARAYDAEQHSQLSSGAWIDPRDAATPFADVARDWLTSNPAKRPATYARDEVDIRRRLLPSLGARAIGSVTATEIQALVKDWSLQVKPRTVRRRYGTLRAILNHAVERDLISRSPCRAIKLPAPAPIERPIVTGEQLAALVSELGDTGLMATVGALLGLRWGEVAGLRVGRIDFDEGTIAVAEQVTRGSTGASILGEPKSAAGRRTLAIPDSLSEQLLEHIATRGLTPSDRRAFVFAGRDGRHLTYSNWRQRIWDPACKRAGLAGLGFHDLRRANATGLVAEGVDIKTAQHRLGHSDPRLTLAVYAQVVTEADRAAANSIAARLTKYAGDRPGPRRSR